MAQFSKFIRQGQVLLSTGDENSVAAFDRGAGILVVVTRNAAPTEMRAHYDLSGFAQAGAAAIPHRTSATENMIELPAVPIVAGRFTAICAARSLTTFVIAGISP